MQTINDRIGILLEELNMTKTAFAESLKVSQQYVSKLIKMGNPSDLLINDICEKYNVSEDWIRNGTGDMFVEKTRSEVIAEFAGKLMKDEEDSFRRRLIEALASLNENEWEVLAGIAEKIVKNKDQT